MGNSLKDALIKAGVVSQEKLDREKEQVRREKIQKKGPAQIGVHQHHIRTDCDHCHKNSPDIEYYEHSNRSIEAKWLCIRCADQGWIKDECRQTNQSSHSKSGMFRREFGATKKFSGSVSVPQGPMNQPNRNQNQPPQQQNKPQTPAPQQAQAPKQEGPAKPRVVQPAKIQHPSIKKPGGNAPGSQFPPKKK